MVYSKFKGYIYLLLCILLAFISLLILCIQKFVFMAFSPIYTQSTGLTSQQAVLMLIFYSCILLLASGLICRLFISIKIDIEMKTIVFKNLILRQTKSYAFDEFDGFFDTVVYSKGGSNKLICLVKNKQVVKRLGAKFYSNFEEIKDALFLIHYFGFQKSDTKAALKKLFDSQVQS